MTASPRTLTHVPAPVATRCGVVAHRGASGEFPEQTLVAYEQAIAQGAEGLELDVRLTSDGVLVCHHDPTTGRTADRRMWVHASTVEQLAGLDYGSWHPTHARHEPLMPLRRLLVLAEAHPQLKLFIETKHPVPTGGRVEEALREELRYFGLDRAPGFAESRVVMMSFSVLAVRRFRRLCPELPTVQLRERRNVVKSWPAEGCGAQLMGPSIGAVRARPWLVEYWRSRGMGTYVWTVDDPADLRLCRDLGVDWVGTNYPARAVGVLDSRPYGG